MKKVLITIILVLAILIIPLVGVLLFVPKSQTPVTNVQNSNTETADWRTYSNVAENYQISYPSDAKIEGDLRILYKGGTLGICKIDGSTPCGNIPGIVPNDGQGANQDIIIDGKIYKAIGYILNSGTKALFLELPNNLQVRVTIDGMAKNSENDLLKMLSTFKFTPK